MFVSGLCCDLHRCEALSRVMPEKERGKKMLYFCLHANFLNVLTHNRATIKLIIKLLKMIYGDAKLRTNPEPNPSSARKSGELDTDLLVDKLRNMSHLSTITENSPYSTHMGSRRNSHHPSATSNKIYLSP